ncbi:hypothetical protein CYL18_02785 [Pradoshia eiseniae]|uniref:Uncharacterized protein n=1 Tax=Pradoshia eiseniae TaxID=2064768 RepID=A0A2S7N5E2_9BACI|nr:hypothetical protein CYL18_02785 [Pradoshia eiseniae]
MIALIGSMAFIFVAILYALLVLGFPYGEFAMGGKYIIMPKRMRILCGFSVCVQLFAIIILLQTASIIPSLFTISLTKGICFFFAAYLTFNMIMNLLSNSRKEKWVMAPLALLTAICFWITAIAA